MTVSEIVMGGGIGLVLILSLIKIKPLEISPWKALGKSIGRAINGEVLEKVASMQDDVTHLKNEIGTVKTDVGSVKADVGLVQSDVVRLTAELNIVKQNIENVKDRIAGVDSEVKMNAIIDCRSRILCFGDEVFHGVDHTEEHYKQILIDIDKYEDYCRLEPNFENSITQINSKKIKEEYARRIETNDFL